MRMLRWMYAKKVQSRTVKWCGQMIRREEHYVGRRAMEMKVDPTREKEEEKGLEKMMDRVRDDIKEKGLSADDVYVRATWRCMSSYIDSI